MGAGSYDGLARLAAAGRSLAEGPSRATKSTRLGIFFDPLGATETLLVPQHTKTEVRP
jgi:hypothetical protein